MTGEAITVALGWVSIICSGLATAIGLITLGYVLRIWEEGREKKR